ncbi:MAG: topoisomerase C-terminal repeat-containing protein, partial [Balneolaceae bacterium]
LEFTNVVLTATEGDTRADFKTSGKKILFPGFFRAYVEGSDDPEAALETQEIFLPELKEGESIELHKLDAIGHETKPPARFTEATLVKELEKRGVGRPSTYASIISTIQDRGYATSDGKTLIPTYIAFAVTGLLEEYFPDLVDSEFTSELEAKLDDIARGTYDPLAYLKGYYLGEDGLKMKVEKQEEKIDPQNAKLLDLPIEGLNGMKVHVGRFGPYVKTESNGEEITTSLPADMNPGEISADKLKELLVAEKEGPKSLGKHPETGEPVYVLSGRFGPYVQRGDITEENKKPKRVSLLKGMKPSDVDFETALSLLELPRTLGEHPDTGKDVKAGIGRYGPFVLHDGTFKSLKKTDDVLEIDLDRAVELLKEKSKGRGSSAIQDLGKHPETDQPIKVMDGRYGPYIKYGKKNISLPKGTEPEKFSMADAVRLIDEKGKK